MIIEWEWEEAFSKFGFGDGDSWNGTHIVANEIEDLGYVTDCDTWGIHNYMIMNVRKRSYDALVHNVNQESVYTNPDAQIGYDCPREYLPDDIINHLDKIFDEDWGT